MSKITYNVTPFIESLKELGRVALIAMIPVLIDGLTAGVINWKIVASAGIIAILRALDKYIHLEGKVEDNDLLKGGLTRF